MRKGYPICQNGIQNDKGLVLGARPSRIKFFTAPPHRGRFPDNKRNGQSLNKNRKRKYEAYFLFRKYQGNGNEIVLYSVC